MSDFPKFPKAVHFGQALNDPEILIPDNGSAYLATEKMDGANAGVVRQENGFLVHSRNTALAFFGDVDKASEGSWVKNEFRGLVEYVRERLNDHPFNVMKPGDHIFGEWLCPHTLNYPAEMYRHLYVYDPNWFFGWDSSSVLPVPLLKVLPGVPTLEEAQAVLDEAVAESKRPIEGLVLTPAGHPRFPYQPRFKLVRPEFKEEAGKRWAVKKQLQSGPVEDRLITHYPIRAYQKVLEGIRDHEEGSLQKRHTPKVLGMTWHDFMTEFFPKALKKEKFPTVDTMALKKAFEEQTRDLFFTELETGDLPVWADNRERKAA